MREWLGLLALNAMFLGVGTALLAGLGLVRGSADAFRFAGLSLVVGWAAAGIAGSYALMLGARLSVLQVVVLASLLAALGLLASRRVPPYVRSPRFFPAWRFERVTVWAGALVLVAYLELLFLRARLAEPSRWDTWAFWVPKAKSIVYFDGLDTGPGGFTSYANPDYPPLKPMLDAVVFRFVGDVDPGALVVQHWVVAVAFFGAVAALLVDRVRPAILWPSLAFAALLPSFESLVGSVLADEPIALLFALAGVCGALWLLDREVRFLALASFFLATAALVKNEGLMLTLVLFVMLAALTRLRPWRQLLPLAALPILAVLPWRLWLSAHEVPESDALRLGDLVRPEYLLDRTERLGTALRELPPYVFDFDRSLLTVPLVLVVALALAANRPALSVYVVGTLLLGFLGFATVYWASRFPIDWYIDTTADRVLVSLVLFGAALFPLLVAEAIDGPGYSEDDRARSSVVRAADS
jgi:hypothetical protein